MRVESESKFPRIELESLLKETPGPICFFWTMCNFVAVYLTSVQFILQLKLCVHDCALFINLKCLSCHPLFHTESESYYGPGVSVVVQVFTPESRVGVWSVNF